MEVVNPNWRECNKQVKNINAKYNRTMAQWHKHRNDAGSANHAAKVELLAQQLAESKDSAPSIPPRLTVGELPAHQKLDAMPIVPRQLLDIIRMIAQ